MRTTLTLDDDVSALLDRIQKTEQTGLKAVINEALRLGLQKMMTPPPRNAAYQTRGVDGGRCKLPNLDNVAQILEWAEEPGVR